MKSVLKSLLLCLSLAVITNISRATEELKPLYSESVPDTIYLNDGRVLPITFLEESNLKVKYKKCDDVTRRKWSKDKSKVNKIVLADGTVKDYSQYNSNIQELSKGQKIAIGGAAAGIGLAGVAALGIGASIALIVISIFSY
jgi:hypothetical protein